MFLNLYKQSMLKNNLVLSDSKKYYFSLNSERIENLHLLSVCFIKANLTMFGGQL